MPGAHRPSTRCPRARRTADPMIPWFPHSLAAWLQCIICQFARVVKGVDLRSTTGNCAWVRTPQLTPGALACEPWPQMGYAPWEDVGAGLEVASWPQWLAGGGGRGSARPIESPWAGAMKAPHHLNSRPRLWPACQPHRSPPGRGWEQRPLARRSPARHQVPKDHANCRRHALLDPALACCLAALHHMSVCLSGQGGGPKIHCR